MMQLVTSSKEYTDIIYQGAACQKLVEQGIFTDIVSPYAQWLQPPEFVERMYDCMMSKMTECGWKQYTLKLQLSRLEFYSECGLHAKMPELMRDIGEFCQLNRQQGGAPENVRKNSIMTLKSL